MGKIVNDTARWPLVEISWPETPVTDEDIEALIAESELLLARGRHVVINHVGNAAGLNARQRRRFAEYVKQHRARLAEQLGATALIAPSTMVRAIVTAVGWFAPPPYPQRVFETRAEAEAWLRTFIDW